MKKYNNILSGDLYELPAGRQKIKTNSKKESFGEFLDSHKTKKKRTKHVYSE